MKCTTCSLEVEIACGSPLIPTGFWLYDPMAGCDVPDLDGCDRIDCPHDSSPSRYSRMLPPMGSMGEAAPDTHWQLDEGEGYPF